MVVTTKSVRRRRRKPSAASVVSSRRYAAQRAYTRKLAQPALKEKARGVGMGRDKRTSLVTNGKKVPARFRRAVKRGRAR